jgi:lipopolysaccharide transport system ATP-binding protein
MNKQTVIKIENLSKQYRLGNIGTGTISHDVNRFFAKIRGKEDPFLKIGETNDRTQKGNSDLVWALKEINFEVQQGEILGIIGKNGAGKSTLLKILSKVTAPTTGSIKAKGRIASLLEVGTGFHPELTGRENIFLNGAILGMTKFEIKSKLDEIVDFAGIERYLDTPVKRYSSGMMVRLGFAVAAHLEPEILVVDEVLAVGDADFQKKAIGKMQDVSTNQGRTVLFVSHNMGSIERLCNKLITLNEGGVIYEGNTKEGIQQYISSASSTKIINNKKSDSNFFTSIFMVSKNHEECIDFSLEDKFGITCNIVCNEWTSALELSISLLDQNKNRIFTENVQLMKYFKNTPKMSITVFFKDNFFMPGTYSWLISINHPKIKAYHIQEDVLPFNIHETGSKFHDRGHSGIIFSPTESIKIQ